VGVGIIFLWAILPPGTIIEFSIGKTEPLFMRYIGVSDER
jgi:hypothetical protein